MPGLRGGEGLRSDDHADVDQDRQQRHQRDHCRGQSHNAGEGQDQDHNAGENGVTHAGAGSLPAGVTDVDDGGEHAAQEGAQDRQHGGNRHAQRHGIMLAGGVRAFQVIHALQEVVNAQRNGCGQIGSDVAEALDELADHQAGEGNVEVMHGVRHGVRAHIAGGPGQDRADEDRERAGRHVEGQPLVSQPAHHQDNEAHKADVRRGEHFTDGVAGNEGQREAGQSAQHGGAGHVLLDDGTGKGADEHDHAFHKVPHHTGGPGQHPVFGGNVGGQDHGQRHRIIVRHAQAVRHSRHIRAVFPYGHLPCDVGQYEVTQRNGQRRSRHDFAVHDVRGHRDRHRQKGNGRQEVGQRVGKKAEKSVQVAADPQGRAPDFFCVAHNLSSYFNPRLSPGP